MRNSAQELMQKGLAANDIRVSLERNMQCGVGWCGHCQLGPLLLCRDGPVVGYDAAGPLLSVQGALDGRTRAWPCGSSPPATVAS